MANIMLRDNRVVLPEIKGGNMKEIIIKVVCDESRDPVHVLVGAGYDAKLHSTAEPEEEKTEGQGEGEVVPGPVTGAPEPAGEDSEKKED